MFFLICIKTSTFFCFFGKIHSLSNFYLLFICATFFIVLIKRKLLFFLISLDFVINLKNSIFFILHFICVLKIKLGIVYVYIYKKLTIKMIALQNIIVE